MKLNKEEEERFNTKCLKSNGGARW